MAVVDANATIFSTIHHSIKVDSPKTDPKKLPKNEEEISYSQSAKPRRLNTNAETVDDIASPTLKTLTLDRSGRTDRSSLSVATTKPDSPTFFSKTDFSKGIRPELIRVFFPKPTKVCELILSEIHSYLVVAEFSKITLTTFEKARQIFSCCCKSKIKALFEDAIKDQDIDKMIIALRAGGKLTLATFSKVDRDKLGKGELNPNFSAFVFAQLNIKALVKETRQFTYDVVQVSDGHGTPQLRSTKIISQISWIDPNERRGSPRVPAIT